MTRNIAGVTIKGANDIVTRKMHYSIKNINYLAVLEMHGEGAIRLLGHRLRGGATHHLETYAGEPQAHMLFIK